MHSCTPLPPGRAGECESRGFKAAKLGQCHQNRKARSPIHRIEPSSLQHRRARHATFALSHTPGSNAFPMGLQPCHGAGGEMKRAEENKTTRSLARTQYTSPMKRDGSCSCSTVPGCSAANDDNATMPQAPRPLLSMQPQDTTIHQGDMCCTDVIYQPKACCIRPSMHDEPQSRQKNNKTSPPPPQKKGDTLTAPADGECQRSAFRPDAIHSSLSPPLPLRPGMVPACCYFDRLLLLRQPLRANVLPQNAAQG